MLVSSADHAAFAARLAAVAAVADAFPGVVIVNRIPDAAPAYMSRRGLDLLGLTLEEVTSMPGADYHARYFNTRDEHEFVARVMDLVTRNEPGTICTYFQQVRTRAGHPWEWYSTGTTIFAHAADGQPSHLLTLAMPVDPRTDLDPKVQRLLDEKTFRRAHAVQFDTLTRREREVLRLTAQGQGAAEVAATLGTTSATAETHRRNLRAKLGLTSAYELVQFAQAFDLL